MLWYSLLTGSGSSYLYGFMDQVWKEGMSKDEAEVRQSDEALISYPTYVLYNLFVLTTYGVFFFFFFLLWRI